MRRWLLALAGVLLLFGGALAVAAYNLDGWLNRNRDALARQASGVLGREVRFGEIGVSLADGLAMRVDDLEVGEDPAFAPEPFLTAEAAAVRVALWPALRGRVEVRSVELRRPVVRVIRTAAGLSTESLGSGSQGPAGGAEAGAGAGKPRGEVLVALVDVEDGTFRYLDRTQDPPRESALEDVDFEASDVTLDAPVAFELEAAVLGATRHNLRASGRVGPVSRDEPPIELELSLSPFDVARAFALPALAARLPSGLAGAGEATLELSARGTRDALALDAKLDARGAELSRGSLRKPKGQPLSLSLRAQRRGSDLEIERAELVVDETKLELAGRLHDLESPRLDLTATSPAFFPASFGAGSPGDALRDLAFEGSLSLPGSGSRFAGNLRVARGALGGDAFEGLALELGLADDRLEIPKLTLRAFGGALTASGGADLRTPARPVFEARAQVDGMRLEQILARYAPSSPDRASGAVTARVEVRGAGASWAAIEPTLVAGGDVSVASGVLRGFNPARQAMQAIVDLPVFSGRKLRPVMRAHPQVFETEDTPFESIASRLDLADREVNARDAQLVSSAWDVRGAARYRLRGQLRSNAVMAFSKPMSDELVAGDKRLRLLRSREGRVEFPVVIRTRQERIAVEPDLAYIANSASREVAADLVDGAIHGKQKLENGVEAIPPASAKELGRDLLRRGLGGLLGGGSGKDEGKSE